MRLGTWRGVGLAAVLVGLLACGTASANDPFHHTIPKEVDAIDLNTGGPYMAPPVPYGHYAKGHLFGRFCGCLTSPFHMLGGLGHGLCGGCGGKGCGQCCGTGKPGGCGLGLGHGNGHGCGHGPGDPGCSGPGCGLGLGHGHGKRFAGCGLCGGKGCGICTSTIVPSAQSAPGVATTLAPVASPQAVEACGVKGCGLKGGHHHGGLGNLDPGGACGNGLGGLGHGLGHGNGCGACGGRGCGLCGGHGGKGCGACGGKGCKLCLPHGLGLGLINGLLHPHAGKVEYFVGPGGPVPITPGYVPWVNPVRSPRDYFAFPPFSGQQ